MRILDTDTGSPTYNLPVDSIDIPLLLCGKIAVTPDGTMAVVNWQGSIAHAVDIIDVDPTSPTYNTVIGSPVPVVSALCGDVEVSPDGDFAYATGSASTICHVCKIDLQTFDILINFDGISQVQNFIALTPDGSTLLTGGMNTTALFVLDTSDLTLAGSVEIGADTNLGVMAITPDGTKAYVVRDPLSVDCEVVVVPLL